MLSIVVVCHNMQREAPRTLYSLSAAYQHGVDASQYEVIAVDNASARPLDTSSVLGFGSNFRYHFNDTDSVSPVGAVNRGVSLARGEFVAVIVDGARMASPGLVACTQAALVMHADPIVGSLAWHLGPEVQNISLLSGYNQSREDELLRSINWPEDGYRLFDVSTLAQSSRMGFWGGMPSELSWLAMRRETFDRSGGFNPAFRSKGGGLVNQDMINRLVVRPHITVVMLLGEGVFHQFHGGVATNVPMAQHPISHFKIEYQQINGHPFKRAYPSAVHYFGTVPQNAQKFVRPMENQFLA